MTNVEIERVHCAVGSPLLDDDGGLIAHVVAARIDLQTGGVRCVIRFPCGHRRVLREGEISLERTSALPDGPGVEPG
jgi:hypothetical protein